MTRHRDGGFVAGEWVLAIALLLLPVVVLVASLSNWAERRHAATVAAREAAAVIVHDIPDVDSERAVRIAETVAENHGVDAADVSVEITGGLERGDTVHVAVSVRMPAIALPGAESVAGWTFTAQQDRRIDDYFSR